MHLVSCATPPEPLEDAPRSALLSEIVEGEQWDGFWSSDVYFVRHTTQSGQVEWFALEDDEPTRTSGGDARVLTLRPATRPRSRVSVVVAQSPDGRRMLVGSARRNPR